MDHLKFVIEPSEAETMAKKQGFKSVLHLLPFIARSAQKLARPPISGFSVGAVGLASDGRIFIGVNVEFPGLPLHHSIHAEQFLITNLSRFPNTSITNVVVSAYPCGHCRQFLQEIRGASDIQIFVLQNDHDYDRNLDGNLVKTNGFLGENGKNSGFDHDHDHHDLNLDENLVKINGFSGENGKNSGYDFKSLSYFLPHRFGPDDLLEKDVPLILETHENGMILLDDLIGKGQNGNLTNGFSSSFSDPKRVVLAALDAANRSHAPYSGCPSGMVVVDQQGNLYSGSYMESAAYNPSLGPAQAAVIAYIASTADPEGKGGAEAGYGDIVGAVLVEKEGAMVRQEETVRLFLKAVAPNCEFHVYHCNKNSSSNLKATNLAI